LDLIKYLLTIGFQSFIESALEIFYIAGRKLKSSYSNPQGTIYVITIDIKVEKKKK
ncbi:hypothetical protein LCGC14_3039450, partial [marine sediment metagenome]